MKVKTENVKKWVEALRSGKYQQVDGRLSNGVGYCCLGVACEVAIENGVVLRKLDPEERAGGQKSVTYSDASGDSEGELPDVVARWLGFEWENEYGDLDTITDPDLPTKEHKGYTAISWNDAEKATFAQIADLIEAQYLAEKSEP